MDSNDANRRRNLLSELGLALLKVNALKIGSFETASGKLTPYFIDLRRLPSFPSAFSLAVECLKYKFAEKEKSLAAEYLCGIPISGLILTTLLASNKNLPLIYPSKAHPNSIVGHIRPGAEVLIVGDVTETGLSMKSTIQAVRASSGVVNHALTLIDRSEEASNLLSQLGVILHYFTTTEELVSTLRNNMALSEEQIEALGAGEN